MQLRQQRHHAHRRAVRHAWPGGRQDRLQTRHPAAQVIENIFQPHDLRPRVRVRLKHRSRPRRRDDHHPRVERRRGGENQRERIRTIERKRIAGREDRAARHVLAHDHAGDVIGGEVVSEGERCRHAISESLRVILRPCDDLVRGEGHIAARRGLPQPVDILHRRQSLPQQRPAQRHRLAP